MRPDDHADIRDLEQALDAIEQDVRALIEGLTAEQGVWRATPDSWSVAQCLDHLATANRVYLRAMEPSASQALQLGGWFAKSFEPPVRPRFKMRAPKKIVPRESPALADAVAQFLAAHEDTRSFLTKYADIDLAGVRFPNPFIRGVRFSLATGLHVTAAHDRRHLWQAWNVRRAEELARGRRTEAPA
jgi:hypothetical protein